MKLQIFWCCVKKKKKKKKKINKYNKPGERKHSSHMVSDGSHIFYI